MVSTSLNAAGFSAPADLSSSASSSYGSSFQGLGPDTDQEEGSGANFRQMMSSYTQSEQSSEAPRENRSSQSQDETSDQPSTVAKSTNNISTSPAETAVSTGSGQLGVDGLSEPDLKSPIQPSTSLSAIQILLKGGTRAQVISLSTINKSSEDAVSGIAPNTQASTAGSVSSSIVLPGHSFSGVGLPLKGKPTTTKAGESRATQQDTASSDTNLALADLPNSASSLSAAAPSTSGNAALNVTTAAFGQSPEALQARMVNWNGSSVQPEAKNLAFAVRLTGAGAQTTNVQPTATQDAVKGGSIEDPQSIVTVPAAGQSSEKSAGEGAGNHAGEQGSPQLAPADLIVTGEGVPTSQISTGSATASVADSTSASSISSDSETAGSAEPVRNVHLQLTGDNNQRVDIRMVEVAGEMRVSVRAGDTKLADTLQEHIPDLAKNLNQQPIRAEIWTPRSETAPPANSSNLGGQSSRGSDSSGQGGQQRQGNGSQNQKQPEWVDELENYSSPKTTIRSN